MRYTIEGEYWLPEYETKKELNVTLEQLTHAVNEGTLRMEVLTNPHNDRDFKVYAIEDLEDVLCSKTRIKILKLLFNLRQLNTSGIAQRLGINYATTIRHLTLLEKEGVVIQRLSGKTRFFRLSNTLKARATIKLLEEWE